MRLLRKPKSLCSKMTMKMLPSRMHLLQEVVSRLSGNWVLRKRLQPLLEEPASKNSLRRKLGATHVEHHLRALATIMVAVSLRMMSSL